MYVSPPILFIPAFLIFPPIRFQAASAVIHCRLDRRQLRADLRMNNLQRSHFMIPSLPFMPLKRDLALRLAAFVVEMKRPSLPLRFTVFHNRADPFATACFTLTFEIHPFCPTIANTSPVMYR